MTQEEILLYGVRLISVLLVIPVHEFAHAWAANRLGDDTPIYQGRLTLNPFAHFDLIGGLLILLTGYGWGKPVQVNPLRFKHSRKGMMLTAAAGPLSNIIFGTVTMIIMKFLAAALTLSYSAALYWIYYIFMYITVINFGLAVFNLIPIPPLDGSKILAYFLPPKAERFINENLQMISVAFFVLIVLGVLDTPIGWLQNGLWWIADKLTFWVDLIIKAVV